MLEVECPLCGLRLQIPEAYRGQSGTCRKCGGIILVPEDAKAAAVQEEAPVTKQKKQEVSWRPVIHFLAAIYGVLLLILLFGYIVTPVGSSMSLIAFCLFHLYWVCCGFLFLYALHSPDKYGDMLQYDFKRMHALIYFVPPAVISFLQTLNFAS